MFWRKNKVLFASSHPTRESTLVRKRYPPLPKTIGAKSWNIKELAARLITFIRRREERYTRKKEKRGSCKIIATNPDRAWCSGVAHVDRERRLPRIAEMHVEAGGQSDLVGKRSRCDSTDSVENLGIFARTRTNERARTRTHARVRACRTRGHGRGGRAWRKARGERVRGLTGKEKKDAPLVEWREGLKGNKDGVCFIGGRTKGEGSQKEREAGGEWRVDRERPYVFCLKKNVSCIRDKEKTEREEGGQFYLK